ncbi:MAG: hypothetical protein ACLR23_18690 [Clostridia bacterium]
MAISYGYAARLNNQKPHTKGIGHAHDTTSMVRTVCRGSRVAHLRHDDPGVSTGAGCNHRTEHVSTQMPYALMVAACCFVSYIVAGLQRGTVGSA